MITLKVYAHFIEDKKNDVQDLANGDFIVNVSTMCPSRQFISPFLKNVILAKQLISLLGRSDKNSHDLPLDSTDLGVGGSNPSGRAKSIISTYESTFTYRWSRNIP